MSICDACHLKDICTEFCEECCHCSCFISEQCVLCADYENCGYKNRYIPFLGPCQFYKKEEKKMINTSANVVCDDCIHACVCKWKSDYAEFSARLNEDFILCCKNYKDKDEK